MKQTRKVMELRNDKRWQLNADVFKGQWINNLKIMKK